MKIKKNFITIALLVISLTFTAIGIMREEHLEVLAKAVRVCLECIGIG